MDEKVFGLPAGLLANSMIVILIAISIILASAQQIFIKARNHIQNFLNFERL